MYLIFIPIPSYFKKYQRDLIKPDKLEDLMITVSLKHLGIPPALEILGIHMSTQEIDAQILMILQAVFSRIDALLRRLQVNTQALNLCSYRVA